MGTFKIKRSKGTWIYGVLTYVGDTHCLHEVENRFVDDNLTFEISLPLECPILCCLDDGLIMEHNKEIKVMDAK